MRRDRWDALSDEEREGFVPLCPDAVFEVRSRTQTPDELRQKMWSYVRNGAAVAVILDPSSRTVEVYRPEQDPEVHRDPERVRLGPELPGFELDVAAVFSG